MHAGGHQRFHDPDNAACCGHAQKPADVRVLSAIRIESQCTDPGLRVDIAWKGRDARLMPGKIVLRQLPWITHEMHLSHGLERQFRWLAVLNNPSVGADSRSIRKLVDRVENALRKAWTEQVVIVEKTYIVRRCFVQTLIEVVEYASIVRSATVLEAWKL